MESSPATSRRTSSPPLYFKSTKVSEPVQFHVTRVRSGKGVEEAARAGLSEQTGDDIRVLIDEARDIVDLVVDNEVEVLLGVVRLDLRAGELLVGRHGDCVCVSRIEAAGT